MPISGYQEELTHGFSVERGRLGWDKQMTGAPKCLGDCWYSQRGSSSQVKYLLDTWQLAILFKLWVWCGVDPTVETNTESSTNPEQSPNILHKPTMAIAVHNVLCPAVYLQCGIYIYYIYGICYIFLHQNLQRALCINPDFQMDRLEGPIVPSQEPRCPRPAPCCRSLACRHDELPARPDPRHIVRFIQFFSQRSQFGVYFDTASAHENCSKVRKPWVYYGILMYIIYPIVQLGESIATFFFDQQLCIWSVRPPFGGFWWCFQWWIVMSQLKPTQGYFEFFK